MASQLEQKLARTHRLSQVQLEAATSLRLVDLFERTIDPADLRGSTGIWLDAAIGVVGDGFSRSQAIAQNYIRTLATAVLLSQALTSLPSPNLDTDAARTSLLMRGPGIIERARRRGTDLGQAFRLATAEQARAGSRHALDASRKTVDEWVAGTPNAGWRRITSGSACSFCSMLAGRGAVYSEQSVGFQAHDGCNCQPGVVFREGTT